MLKLTLGAIFTRTSLIPQATDGSARTRTVPFTAASSRCTRDERSRIVGRPAGLLGVVIGKSTAVLEPRMLFHMFAKKSANLGITPIGLPDGLPKLMQGRVESIIQV
jgi:hypothetical protein